MTEKLPAGSDGERAPLASWLPEPGKTTGSFEGAAYGSEVSFFVVDAAPGEGPALHRHPYSETFVVQAGRARFELDGGEREAAAGNVVVVPPTTVHRFWALGPDRLRLVAIHASPVMETTWIDEEKVRGVLARRHELER